MRLLRWWRVNRPNWTRFSLAPDEVITPWRRWWIVPPHNGVFNIYLHHWVASDADRDPHDHPWGSLTIVLRGVFIEFMPANPKRWPDDRTLVSRRRSFGSVVVRRAEDIHRIDLRGRSAWTLFLTLGKRREWGFWTREGWVHQDDYFSKSETPRTRAVRELAERKGL